MGDLAILFMLSVGIDLERCVPPPWPIFHVVSQKRSMHLVSYRCLYEAVVDILPPLTNMFGTELRAEAETMYTVEGGELRARPV